MALELSNDIDFRVERGKEVIVDSKITINKLTKKDQKKISTLIKKIDNESVVQSIEEYEKAAKARFDLQVSGDGKDAVKEFAEEYGYLLVMSEIDEKVGESKGKH